MASESSPASFDTSPQAAIRAGAEEFLYLGGVPPFNYDFWYQPRKSVLASSEFGEPNAYEDGVDIADVAARRRPQA